jgi:outer membrane protein assembly factor BamB
MNKNLLSKLFIVFSVIYCISCNKLQIDNFYNNTDPKISYLQTYNLNYQRNNVIEEEIDPPIELVFEDNFNGLATKGFSAVDSILFFGTGKGYLVAFDLNKNKVVGKKKFGLSTSAPPTIYDNILYQAYDNGDYGLIAYDVAKGDKLWEIEKCLTSSSPIVVENKVFYQSNQGKVFCLNYLTGETIWKVELNCFGMNSIAYENGILISTNQDGAIYALEYTSGSVLWKKILNDKIFANPVINENFVFISTYNGHLHKINIENGFIIQSKDFNYPLYYSVTIDKKNIYVPISDGEVKALEKSNLIELWSYTGNGPVASSIVISNNYAYVPTLGKYLYILDKTTGKKLQEIKLEGRAKSVPLIKNGRLIIASEDDNVNIYAISK